MRPASADRTPGHESPNQILALVGHGRNRRMLEEFLGEAYSMRTDMPADPASIDLVVVDDRKFNEVRSAIEQLIEAAMPTFCPVLLLTAHDPERLGGHVWETVDEIVTVPVAKRELQLRLDSLAHRRAASVALKADQETSEARFRSLYEAVPDPIVAVAEDGTITEANEPFRRMVSRSLDELLGEDISELALEPEEAVERLLLGIDPTETDTDRVVSVGEGSEEPVVTELNVNALESVGHLAERIGIFRDVTRRESARHDLERQNERLDDFTSVVAHDLRNPLTIATGRVELAQETGNLEHLERAAEALEYMATLIGDLLDWSKQGDLVTDMAAVDLAAVARAAWEMTGAETDCSIAIPAEGTWIWADEDRLRQVFENLFRNAIEHTEGPVCVTVETLDDGFAVEDDGGGFEADPGSVFEPGYSSTDQGSGLGLATVARIAEAHGWEVSAGEGADGGARFEFHSVRSDSTEE